MPSPFPGMDPYLEHPRRWHPLHTRLIVRLEDLINQVLPNRYYTSVEERAYLILGDDPEEVQLPDVLVYGRTHVEAPRAGGVKLLAPLAGVEVLIEASSVLKQRYLEVRDLQADERVVTVVEILSPSNKRPGVGRDDYVAKRSKVFDSRTNLIEIDLLRAGPRLPALGAPEGADYGILISRVATRPRAQYIPFTVRDTLPSFPLPLVEGDDELILDIGPSFSEVYDSRRYGERVDYRQPPEPAFKPGDEEWADRLLRERGLR